MSDCALVTIAIGEPCLANWNKYCAANWQAYAARHGVDLIVITEPLGAERSPSWQKCLVLCQPWAAKYRQVAMVDADVAINAESPSIFEQLNEDKVGGVIAGSHIHEDLRPVLLSRLTNKQIGYAERIAAWQWDQNWLYENAGLTPRPEGVIQCGVLLASPRQHAELFRAVYDCAPPPTKKLVSTSKSRCRMQFYPPGYFGRSTRGSTACCLRRCWFTTISCSPKPWARR